MTENIINIIVSVLVGIATCVPLVVKLVQYVKQATQEKNWGAILGLVVELMEEAEVKFADGATRKEWVMAMVKTSAEYVSYPIDSKALSDMIDGLCDMANVVNGGAEVDTAGETT